MRNILVGDYMRQEMQKKLENIENDIKLIKTMIKIKDYKIKKAVSLRGIAKTTMSSTQLDCEIEKSKKSISSHEEM